MNENSNIILESDITEHNDAERQKNEYPYIFRNINKDVIIPKDKNLQIKQFDGTTYNDFDGKIIRFLCFSADEKNPEEMNIIKIDDGIYMIGNECNLNRYSHIKIYADKSYIRLQINL